ncbi:MAG TPA: hypothetical protein VGN56_02475 [Candidatus Paceibacterota bacterium]|jgi:hypothetical protein|nr:hypothetical protein [Candidatus Paceibacterota bacterium]
MLQAFFAEVHSRPCWGEQVTTGVQSGHEPVSPNVAQSVIGRHQENQVPPGPIDMPVMYWPTGQPSDVSNAAARADEGTKA